MNTDTQEQSLNKSVPTTASEKSRVPRLRFAGFSEPWEERKVSEIGNVVTGSTPKTSVSDNYGGEFLFVSPADIQGNRYVDETITTLTQKGFDQGRKIRAKASLFVSIGSTIGKVAQTHQEATTNQQINAVEPYDDFDDDFIFTSLENMSESIKAIASNQAVPIVNKTTFGETEIQVPSELTEQQRIGAFFKQLDTLITLHQRKLDKLKTLKQSCLEKMFPAEGENTPVLRFSGFTDPWEQRKLGEVAERYDNLRVPITANKRLAGDTPYYGANGIQDYVSGFTHDGEYILIAEDGANDLDNYPVYCVSGKIWVNNHAHVVQAEENLSENNFLAYAIKRVDIKPMLVGGDRSKLNAEPLMSLLLSIPTLEEQQRIGAFFKQLDTLIALHQRKLDKLKTLKQSCLEKMFV